MLEYSNSYRMNRAAIQDCISNLMFCDLERIANRQRDMSEYTDPYRINCVDIKDGLRKCNVPAWLEFIHKQSNIRNFNAWRPRYNLRRPVNERCAVNIANLQIGDIRKKTIELRAHQGSIDVAGTSA